MRPLALLHALLLAMAVQVTPAAAAPDPNDWAQLGRYRDANATLPAPAAGQPRVVFMGDSITEGWKLGANDGYADLQRVNRGISGQTTPQMLVRFRPDVLALKPRVVVILAGTNDIAGNTGPATDAEIAGNIASMVELALAHGLRVVLVSVLPADRYWWNTALRPAARIVALNRLLAAYAKDRPLIWVDLHTPMADANQGLKPVYGEDGVHPNDAGYRAMRGPVEAAIAQALR